MARTSLLKRMTADNPDLLKDAKFVDHESAQITLTGASSKMDTTIEILSKKQWVRLYTPIAREDRVYTYADVPKDNVSNCLSKKGKRIHGPLEGKRLFFEEHELPRGWRIPNQDDYPYQCPIETCPKLLQSIQKLVNHVRGFHGPIYEFYKEELMAELAIERESQREIRKDHIKRTVEGREKSRERAKAREERLAVLAAAEESVEEFDNEEEDDAE